MRTSDQLRQPVYAGDPANQPLPPGPLGRRLAFIHRRDRMGYTIRGFARHIGVSYETVRRFEWGYIPSPHIALKLANAFGVDYDEVVPQGSRDLAVMHRQMLKAAA
jgi:DNA-binding XRE family transcriptional regulator